MEMLKTENARYHMEDGEFGKWLDELGIDGACKKMEMLNAFGVGDYTSEKYEEDDIFTFDVIEKELGIV
ncbi:MAG: hypothetical protein IJ029_10050 [Lachnospiraceae bacterium]|nr:hypothetical protein [Lachnospiraceae bacterium]